MYSCMNNIGHTGSCGRGVDGDGTAGAARGVAGAKLECTCVGGGAVRGEGVKAGARAVSGVDYDSVRSAVRLEI